MVNGESPFTSISKRKYECVHGHKHATQAIAYRCGKGEAYTMDARTAQILYEMRALMHPATSPALMIVDRVCLNQLRDADYPVQEEAGEGSGNK